MIRQGFSFEYMLMAMLRDVKKKQKKYNWKPAEYGGEIIFLSYYVYLSVRIHTQPIELSVYKHVILWNE